MAGLVLAPSGSDFFFPESCVHRTVNADKARRAPSTGLRPHYCPSIVDVSGGVQSLGVVGGDVGVRLEDMELGRRDKPSKR